ncbi:conserved hypothetical protein [Uncinocarpus reesii 1704]|uniref:Peptidase M14 domain-containing protein n=1 Tax=Uncinocarpus reesii (strain UAMH 1704) TaxID=336963 RepID=C4JTQ5_UNCRE|nr:uncharacterized protein UREG_05844 [Uncinocarpus reesii 1704]EEP81002.1 conserved hypothetical protein [Uncinocarpus reesii 1704]
MKSFAILSTLVASVLAATVPNTVSYDGYKVVRIPTEEDNHAQVVKVIENLKLDTWKFPKRAGSDADIVIPPEQLEAFNKAIAGLKVEIMHEDLGASIEDESSTITAYTAGSVAADDRWFTAYHSFNDHMAWLRDLQQQNANRSALVNVGNSHERRPVTGIHIWGSRRGKPAIVWHGTVHAREWITTMVTEYMAAQLLTDPAARSMLEKYDFFIFPIVNPDGFVYTQTRNRMWRKNRTPNGGSSVGTDINRNWPFQWSGSGSSTNPSSETYRAYGYSCTARPDNHNRLISLANTFAQALRAVHGTSFRTGPICNTIYQANGNSIDWAVEVGNVETAFAAELRDTGRFGFILPPNQIIPSGQETWAGVKAMFAQL